MKLLVLDLDGTIIKTNEASNHCFNKTVNSYLGISQYNTKWVDYHCSSDIGIIRNIYKEAYNQLLTLDRIFEFERIYFAYMQDYQKKYPDTFSYIDGFAELISETLNSEWKLAVFTGGFSKTAYLKLQDANITPSTFPISCAYDGLLRNDIFKSVILKSQLYYWAETFDNIIMVGDSDLDIKLSHDLNIRMIGMKTSITENYFMQHEILESVNNYYELLTILEGE